MTNKSNKFFLNGHFQAVLYKIDIENTTNVGMNKGNNPG